RPSQSPPPNWCARFPGACRAPNATLFHSARCRPGSNVEEIVANERVTGEFAGPQPSQVAEIHDRGGQRRLNLSKLQPSLVQFTETDPADDCIGERWRQTVKNSEEEGEPPRKGIAPMTTLNRLHHARDRRTERYFHEPAPLVLIASDESRREGRYVNTAWLQVDPQPFK